MSTPKTLEYWIDPRGSIANRYKDDDIAYATSGMRDVATILRYAERSLTELKECRILEYGCGTGRVARPLTFFFKEVVGYDPVSECVETAKKECSMPLKNLVYVESLVDITPNFEYTCSVNVLEHLSYDDACKAIHQMIRYTRPGGKIILWYHPVDNNRALEEYFPEQARTTGKTGIYIDSFTVNKH
jgi:2-polyprenyl-3-methyl-5-hydroxy-6-metoxy-1,4-benzoquinol methylase